MNFSALESRRAVGIWLLAVAAGLLALVTSRFACFAVGRFHFEQVPLLAEADEKVHRIVEWPNLGTNALKRRDDVGLARVSFLGIAVEAHAGMAGFACAAA